MQSLRPLGWARAAFGLVFLARTTPLLAPLHLAFLAPAWPLLGWPDSGWHAPVAGLSLPPAVVACLCVLRTIGALGLLLGIKARAAGLIAGLAGYLVLAQDAFGYFHHLHMLYLGAILLGLSDAGSAFALRPTTPISPASSVWLLRVWVASIYTWAALARLRVDWLDGRALALFHTYGLLNGRFIALLLATPARRIVTAWIIAFGELALGPALLLGRTRRLALAIAILFHAVNEVVARVDSIGWQMLALLLVFVDGEKKDVDANEAAARDPIAR